MISQVVLKIDTSPVNKWDLKRHFSDAYIVVKGTITVTNPDNKAYDKKLAFKSNAPLISYTSKINNALIDHAEELDIVMPM